MNFVALDFETANAARNSACSLGMVKVVNDEIVKEWYELIKPPTMQFDYRNIAIHGITPKDVVDKRNFGELWEEIREFIGDFPLLAHNASFDFSVIRYCLDTYNIPYPDLTYFCSVIAAKISWPELERHDLHTVSDNLCFKFKHHDALEDARACANVFIAACKKHQVNSLEEFCEKSGTCSGRIHRDGYSAASMKKAPAKKAVKKSISTPS